MLAQGRAREALPHAERAVRLFGTDPGYISPFELAEAQYALAQLLAQTGGDRNRARVQATAARDFLARSTDQAPLRARIEQWLAQHAAP